MLMKASIGNIGGATLACDQINYADIQNAFEKNQMDKVDHSLDFKCKPGQQLGLLHVFGVTASNKTVCTDITKSPSSHYKNMTECTIGATGALPVTNTKGKSNPVPSYDEVARMQKFDDSEAGKLLQCYKDRILDSNIDLLPPKSWLELRYICNCVGKSECSISLLTAEHEKDKNKKKDYLWDYSEECSSLLEKGVKERNNKAFAGNFPIITASAECVAVNAYNELYANAIPKQLVGWIIVGVEILVGLLFIGFVTRLEVTQKRHAEDFDLTAVQMEDFTIRVRNLPRDHEYENDLDVLRGYLTVHCETVI